MIWINFLRDLKSTASRLVSVAIITCIAVLVYTALNGMIYNIDVIATGYFQRQNVADYWINGVGLSEGDCRTLQKLPGVTGVQPRIVYEAEPRGREGVVVQLYAVGDYAINKPYLTAGRLPASDREILLSGAFAQAQGIRLGDMYEMTLADTDARLRLQVCGFAQSPECVYHVNATTPSPDFSKYGFAYMNQEALADLVGKNNCNQICITTDGTVADSAIRRQIHSSLGDKVVNVLALEDNTRANYLMETKDNLALIIQAFPLLFFLCAVLLMVSTMNRMIESARTTVGTFKALGYYDGTIMRYYLLHAVLVVVVGFTVGAMCDTFVSRFIVDTIAGACDIPAYTIVHDFAAWWQALALTAACCIGSAWLVARSLLKEGPAQCMRPKPPKSSKSMLLERMGPLWRHVSFNGKYILRNTFRNKVRMLTCVVGIALCMALVLVAFALRDSLEFYSESLVENQNKYDVMVNFKSGVAEGQYSRIRRAPGVEQVEYEMGAACWLYSDSQLTTATVTVTEDRIALKLYAPYAPGEQQLPPDGLVLESSIAEKLGVGAGDAVNVRFLGDPRYYRVRVAQVDRDATGAYMGRSCWRSLGRPYTPTAAYVKTADRAALQQALDHYDFVDAWQTREAITNAIVQKMRSMSLVVYVLIVFGGGLACVVIYNLGIMSFFEQMRSLATLMVLGFYEEEIKRLQLSENILFAIGGICLGLPLGIWLNHFIISAVTTMTLTVATKPVSYVLATVVTMLFTLAVNGVIGRKMRDIDMLGALKSVE